MKHKIVKKIIDEAKGNVSEAMKELTWAFDRVNSVVSMDGYEKTGYRKEQPQQMLKEITKDFSHALFEVSFLHNLLWRLDVQIRLDNRERNS